MQKRKSRAPVVIGVILFIILGLPLILVGISFIGRITPDSVIPDSFDLYASAPNPVRLASRILGHESLPDIMALAEMAPLMPLLDQLKDSGLMDNIWVRLAARGRLDAAFLSEGRILASWNAGVLSPLLRILPLLAGALDVPGLYYVRAGKNSRFEYRGEDGTVFFIGPFRNLLIISNDSALFESVPGGSSRDGGARVFQSRNHDIAFLLTPALLMNTLRGSDIPAAINLLQFPGPIEASLTILPKQLKLNLISPLGANNQALQKIIERNSKATPLSGMIPDSAQYLTLFSAGSLSELLDGVSAINGAGGTDWQDAMRIADRASQLTLSMSLEELLFSWTGTQFAVYGLEGRPNPVIAVEIRDENKRRDVFEKAFRSLILNENIQLNLDGNRIPRIQVPGFLNNFLRLLKVDVPSPYYTVQDNYLFICESAETLLSAVNAVRRNQVLPRTDLWRTLSQDNSGPSSFSLFYSIDPSSADLSDPSSMGGSLPFFLKGNNEVSAVLRLYRQGLARLSFENSVLTVSLQAIPGAGSGIVPVVGYPLDIAGLNAQGRAGSSLYQLSSGKDTRLLFTRGNDVLALNPLDRSVKELQAPGASGSNFYAIPVEGAAGEGVVWVVDSRGNVDLANKDMENLRGFPISTGIRLSAPPGAWGGKLFLCDEDGLIYTVDSGASVGPWGTGFSEALRSPPSFLDFRNRGYAASYLKSFLFGGIYLHDLNGSLLQNWPVPVYDIAFGSPLLFTARQGSNTERLFLAFITQAGELTVYTETAQPLEGFPLELEGVFYLQPVFDGESLWIIESEGTLYRIGLDGETLSHTISRLSVREGGYITVADISGGRRNSRAPKEAVFFTGEGNALYGYSRNFISLDGFPLPVWGRPLIGDLQGSGKVEVAGMGMDNKLYLWQFR
jgi:hypothetical protein